MYIDYDDLDYEYEGTPVRMKMQKVRYDGEPRREKSNKPPRRDKWDGVIARNRVERNEND